MTSLTSSHDAWTGAALNQRPCEQLAQLMAIINVTPDSFSDGGLYDAPERALQQARSAIAAGADYLDVGGESTRPGSEPISAETECERVVPAIEAISALNVPISIDTSKADVAAAALAAGAHIINDVSAGRDPEMFAVAASSQAPIILMHMQGTPADMQDHPQYDNVVDEVIQFLIQRMALAQKAGVDERAIMLDPGIGFGKTLEQNIKLLTSLDRIKRETGRPLLVGLSRKSYLPLFMGRELAAAERDVWSHYFHAEIAEYCAVLRVHDVCGAREALRVRALFRGSKS